ncbi:Leucine-rich repeat-containing protein 37B [Tupaia chinensis]|uniref:Leucine-rich repeat-containing protein 37B n=1 Tax=Tupaia chinensis TaxID=246437 RepID=L9KL34_TUPCH|nr:Leucine-rich repeat-containing protein 37B [Tupaia chinensis]
MLTLQPLWLLVQAAQPTDWAQVLDRIISDSSGLTKSWTSYPSHHPPKTSHVLTPPANLGGFDYLESSAPAQMLASLAPPLELTETLAPFLDTDSDQEIPPEPHPFAVLHQDLHDKLSGQEMFSEVIPVPGWDQNHPLDVLPQLQSNVQTVGEDQTAEHQWFEIHVPPLDSQSLKAAKFIVSPKDLQKDLAQHRQLATVVIGTPDLFASKPQQEVTLQAGYADTGYSGGILPSELQVNSNEPAESPEQVQFSQFQLETQTQNAEEVQLPLQQKEPLAQPPQPYEEVASPLAQQEALAEHPLATEDAVPQLSVPSPGQNEAQQSHLPNVTVQPADLTLVITTEAYKEVEPYPSPEQTPAQPPEEAEEIELSPTQQEAPAQPPEHPGEVEPATQQEAPAQPSGLPMETELSPTEQEQPAPPFETSGGVEASEIQQEVPAKPTEPFEEVKPFPVQQEAPAQAPEFASESISQTHQVTVRPPGQNQVPHNLPSVTVKPADVVLTIMAEPTKETESSSTQQGAISQLGGPLIEAEPSLVGEKKSNGFTCSLDIIPCEASIIRFGKRGGSSSSADLGIMDFVN